MTPTPPAPEFPDRRAELLALLERRLCGEATPADADRVEQILAEQPALFVEYLHRLHLHVCLSARFRQPQPRAESAPIAVGAIPDRATRQESGPAGRRLRPAIQALAAVAALAALSVGVWWRLSSHDAARPDDSAMLGSSKRRAEARPTAQLIRAIDAQWDSSSETALGETAPTLGGSAHRFSLRAGLAEIRYASGVTVLLQGPAVLEIAGPSRGLLRCGRLVVTVPASSCGFVIATPTAEVTDLGTEFGVACDGGQPTAASSDTTVQVYRGEVVAEARAASAGGTADRAAAVTTPAAREAAPARLHLTTGQAALISVGSPMPVPVPFRPDRFVRRFPSPTERKRETGLPETPYNVPSLTELRIRPAPGPVTIDGELADWDLAGEFRGRCAEPFGGTYHVRGAMMYDAAGVYIAAEIGDPDPLRNVYADGDANPWRGGAVQVRLSTDPLLGWPIDADSTRRPRRPRDCHPRLCHLTLWHSATLQRACLQVAYGMDYHGVAFNPVGFRGVVKPTSDESARGYRLEYFVPWLLLGVTDGRPPPRPGDTTGVSWTVHWAYDNGRDFRGQWVDLVHPDYRRVWTFQKACSWGRALWEPWPAK